MAVSCLRLRHCIPCWPATWDLKPDKNMLFAENIGVFFSTSYLPFVLGQCLARRQAGLCAMHLYSLTAGIALCCLCVIADDGRVVLMKSAGRPQTGFAGLDNYHYAQTSPRALRWRTLRAPWRHLVASLRVLYDSPPGHCSVRTSSAFSLRVPAAFRWVGLRSAVCLLACTRLPPFHLHCAARLRLPPPACLLLFHPARAYCATTRHAATRRAVGWFAWFLSLDGPVGTLVSRWNIFAVDGLTSSVTRHQTVRTHYVTGVPVVGGNESVTGVLPWLYTCVTRYVVYTVPSSPSPYSSHREQLLHSSPYEHCRTSLPWLWLYCTL